MHTLFWLMVGLFLGTMLLLFARTYEIDKENKILSIALVSAAIIYVLFSLFKGDSTWLYIECFGVIIYGLLAWLSVRYSGYFLFVGWMLHPLWDVYLHLLGSGKHIAPEWYAIACVSFDLLIATYVFFRVQLWRENTNQLR